MKYLFLLLITAWTLLLSYTADAQVTQSQISLNPPAVVNFTQLANYELAHPRRFRHKRYIEQEEDREHNYHLRHHLFLQEH